MKKYYVTVLIASGFFLFNIHVFFYYTFVHSKISKVHNIYRHAIIKIHKNIKLYLTCEHIVPQYRMTGHYQYILTTNFFSEKRAGFEVG